MHMRNWAGFAQALENEIIRIRTDEKDKKIPTTCITPASDNDLCRFTCFPLTDDFQLVTCKYCHTSVNLRKFLHHTDICPSNPSNKDKYPIPVPITRDLMVPTVQIKTNNGKKNDKVPTGEKKGKIRKKTRKRRRRKQLSVSEILSGIVGTLPAIAEEPEEDHKILLAAHHISTYSPKPLASPKYVRKNSIRQSIARLPCKNGFTVQESSLPLMVNDNFLITKPETRILSPEVINQAHNQAAARELRRRLQANSSPRKLYFSISPSKARGSSPLSACGPKVVKTMKKATV